MKNIYESPSKKSDNDISEVRKLESLCNLLEEPISIIDYEYKYFQFMDMVEEYINNGKFQNTLINGVQSQLNKLIEEKVERKDVAETLYKETMKFLPNNNNKAETLKQLNTWYFNETELDICLDELEITPALIDESEFSYSIRVIILEQIFATLFPEKTIKHLGDINLRQ